MDDASVFCDIDDFVAACFRDAHAVASDGTADGGVWAGGRPALEPLDQIFCAHANFGVFAFGRFLDLRQRTFADLAELSAGLLADRKFVVAQIGNQCCHVLPRGWCGCGRTDCGPRDGQDENASDH